MRPRPKRKPERVLWTGHPSWKGMLGFYVKFQGAALLLSALFGFLAYSGHFSVFKAIVIIVLANALPLGIGKLDRHFTTYTVTTTHIRESKGVLRKSCPEAPISRIQNVTVKQSLSDRIWGIGTVDFDTAGEKSGDIFVWKGINDPKKVRAQVDYVQSGEDDEDTDLDGTEPLVAPRYSADDIADDLV
jgi:uncharacterized membrane protein YdbT with pleckstrin-like domain